MNPKRLTWYLNRLRAMPANEVSRRIAKAARSLIPLPIRIPSFSAPEPISDLWPFFPPSSSEVLGEKNELLLEAEAYLKRRWLFFGLAVEEPDIDWHRDPLLGIAAPRAKGKSIDYRDPRRIGDAKRIWEKNRHHHLVVMSLAYRLTSDERFSRETAAQIYSWLEQNPFPWGINWSQALEAAVRLISWVWVERLLRGSTHYKEIFAERSFWESVYWHQYFIEKERSFGSSANNHLIGEAAGLFIAATNWPYFPSSRQWQHMAKEILEEEILKQTFPSGLNREQAFEYHLFTTEFFLLSLLEGDRAGIVFSETYQERLRRMIEVLPLLADRGGNLPRYGDGDNGRAVQIAPIHSPRWSWLLRVGRSRLGAEVPSHLSSHPGYYGEIAHRLLLPKGVDGEREGNALWQPPAGSLAFPDAGVFILTTNRNTPDEIFVLADAGELGYLSIAAHGHADALSFTLSIGGRPVLIDPGTYTYYDPDPHWRAYFRSTAAHNTLIVDGKDQSTPAGPFLWTRKARVKVEEWTTWGNGARLRARHDGYAPLGVWHERCLTLEDQRITVVDRCEGSGLHHLALRFHLAPGCIPRHLSETTWEIRWPQGRMLFTFQAGFEVKTLFGCREGGWFSPTFGLKEPVYTLEAAAKVPLPVEIKTELGVIR